MMLKGQYETRDEACVSAWRDARHRSDQWESGSILWRVPPDQSQPSIFISFIRPGQSEPSIFISAPGWTNERQGSVSRSSLSIYPASILDAKTLLACVKVAANTRFGLLKQNIDLVLFWERKATSLLFCPSMKIGSLSSFFAKSYYLNWKCWSYKTRRLQLEL